MRSYWRGAKYNLLTAPDETERVGPLSNALWCNIDDKETNQKGQIGHSFSENDPNRQHFTKTQRVPVPTGNSYGVPTYQERQEVTEVLDICGYHWAKQNPFQPPQIVQSKTINDLEEEDANYRAGFEAGQNHANYTRSHGETE